VSLIFGIEVYSSTEETMNAFSKLAVEDTDELDEPQGDDTNAAPPFEDPTRIKQNEAGKEAEFFFAIQSFVTNVHDVGCGTDQAEDMKEGRRLLY
jgi:hypothetical protein